MPTSAKLVQSILELPATDEIHMEGQNRGSKEGLAGTKPGTNMISMIRINILYLQTVLIKKTTTATTTKKGPASQYRMKVSNMFTVNFLLCPWKANAGRFRNISRNSNETKPRAHMTNYSGVKLDQETSRLTAESKMLISVFWLKLFFIRCFCRKTFKRLSA